MPKKRVIMVAVKDDSLVYALRVDVPNGTEKPVPTYHSIYGDRADPDVAAIRAGQVLEVVQTISVHPEGNETQPQLIQRVERVLEARWTTLQSKVTRTPKTKAVIGRYWDGDGWQQWAAD